MPYVLLRNEKNITKLLQIYSARTYQILLKLVNIWLSYSENQKSELDILQQLRTQCL